MAITISTSLANRWAQGISLEAMLNGGELQLWSGSAPSVDSAATGSLICVITTGAAARTAEVEATALLAFSGGAAGNTCTGITLNGYQILGATVTWDTSDAVTAALVAAQINKYQGSPIKVWATVSAANVTLRACPGQGTALNGQAIVVTCVGGGFTCAINGASADNMGEGAGGSTAGVASANGVTLGEVASGVLSISGAWQGTVLTGSTAVGYVRLEGVSNPISASAADATTTPRYRIQMSSVGVTGADFNMPGGTTLTAGTTFTVNTGTITVPRS